jgi:hypothetical protein
MMQVLPAMDCAIWPSMHTDRAFYAGCLGIRGSGGPEPHDLYLSGELDNLALA